MFRRKRKPDLSLDDRVLAAEAQRNAAAAERPHVQSLARRLRNHLEENHFGERLLEQMIASRRQT